MKTKADQLTPADVSAVWADETPQPAPARRKHWGINWFAVVSVLALVAAIGGSVFVCISGFKALHAATEQIAGNPLLNAQQAAAQLAHMAQVWGVLMTLAAVAGGTVLFAVALWGGKSVGRKWSERCEQLGREAGQREKRLTAELVDTKILEHEARKAHADLQARLANVAESRTSLQQQLDARLEMEKTLAHQAQELERSKDVLEMHVQARTQELQKLQRRTELILTSAGEGICVFDLQGRATFVNPAAAKLTGLPVEKMTGRTESEIFFPNAARTGKKTPVLLKNEEGQHLPEQIFQRKDGSNYPVEYVRTPILEHNRTVGAVVMFKDITERKFAEDKLAHKAAELARSNSELEQFAFVASHDLQEPLRKIQAFGDRLKIKCDAVQLTDGRDYLDRMQSAAARMQTLINDLLTFSRIIRASQPFATVDLTKVTKEVLVDLEHRIEKTKAQVEVGALPVIDADPLQMRQLLQNLIGNALKFQPPGASPVVKVDAQVVTRDQIREDAVFRNPPRAVRPDDKFCVLTVQDNGIGFEEQYLEKIFAVFQRLHGRSEYEGTGVGLAVCRRIADRHGGLITAQSKLGEGATFVVILPIQQPGTKADPQ